MYWATEDNPAVKMASLNGTNQVTLFSESKASYTGITLYKDCLYISDKTRRSVLYISFSDSHNLCRYRESVACS